MSRKSKPYHGPILDTPSDAKLMQIGRDFLEARKKGAEATEKFLSDLAESIRQKDRLLS